MQSWIIEFCVLSLALAVTAHAADCTSPLLPIVHGEQVFETLPFAGRSSSVFLLGKGRYAKVYRVSDATSVDQSRVFKVYQNADEADLDFRRFEILRALVTNQDIFKVAWVHKFDRQILEIEDIKGASLEYLMKSPNVSSSDKQLIQLRFDEALQRLTVILKQKYRKPFVNRAGMIYLDQKDPNPEKKFMLHSGNVIVTPSFEFWIVDPY